MLDIRFTRHAVDRIRQRGLRERDVAFVVEFGTETPNGFIISRKDAQELERQAKWLIQTARRLSGKNVVCSGECVLTAFHTTEKQQRRML